MPTGWLFKIAFLLLAFSMGLIDFVQQGRLEAGCDEAGRGCLAGPVFAAAVVLPPQGFFHPLLNDSKQMSAKERADVREYIEQHARAWAVVWLSAQEIDTLNILRASITGMHRALDALAMPKTSDDQTRRQAFFDSPQAVQGLPLSGCFSGGERLRPEHILVDGPKFYPYGKVQHHCFVKGDGRYTAIAAASVLAKTYRDAYMDAIDPLYPHYHWMQNKGYPTQEHRETVKSLGLSPYHRKSYHLHEEQSGCLF